MSAPLKPILSRLYEARQALQSQRADASGLCQIVAICNQKGGCGKTTTAVNLASRLALRGFPTLLVDLDPQANAGLSFGLDVERLPVTIHDLFCDPHRTLDDVIIQTHVPHLSLMPSNSMLSGARIELATVLNREQVLRRILRRLGARYRYVIIDCSPSLDLLNVNALAAADYALVPLQPHYYALEGMKELFTTIEIVQERMNPALRLLGILPVLVDERVLVVRELLEQIRDYFKDQVLPVAIHISVELIEASVVGQPALLYAPQSQGAHDYEQLTDEVVARTNQGVLVAGDHGASAEATG